MLIGLDVNSLWRSDKGVCLTSLSICTNTTQKATIHQVTTILATSKNVLLPPANHLLTTGADDPSLWLSPSLALKW